MNCKRLLFIISIILDTSATALARHTILNDQLKTLQVVVNQDWLSMPVMRLGQDDVLHVSFDELSHNYHRYIYQLEHCEEDWTPSEDIFESDWLEGFNGNPIEDYENSLNTTVLYTHYQLQIPNDRCHLKMSGNYKLHIMDEESNEEVACAEFRVVEPLTNVGLSVTTNTDIDHNLSHQQVSMTVKLNSLNVTNPEEQLRTVVMQNGREDTQCLNPKPNYYTRDQLQWEHNRALIFDARNEYRKFEVLDVSHPTMGIDHIEWDGSNYHAYPFICEPRRNYLYDEDANGAFYIRNSDNLENDRTSDYVYIHYKFCPAREQPDGSVYIEGQWTTEQSETYIMQYNQQDHSYNATILQKQGYYSFSFRLIDSSGTVRVMPEEGSFFETENRYQAMVYYKPTGGRTWQLVGYQQIVLR